MQIIHKVSELQFQIEKEKKHGKTIGFVPTMGALHLGHTSLVNESNNNCDITVCSIFVNPTQFDNPQDFEKYPSTLEQDIQKLITVHCDYLFVPTVSEMYPKNENVAIEIDLGKIAKVMEGKHRKGHFDGVVKIVYKLFKIVNPDKAFFGEKDFQQLLVVSELGKNYFPQINIIGCPIVRESSGLAMSSRNRRLSKQETNQALILSMSLKTINNAFQNNSSLENEILNQTQKLNALDFISLEYLEVYDEKTLDQYPTVPKNPKLRAFIAAKIGSVRLIDNLALND